jgi:uncharacterized Zn finger protein (UPF0148 family)
MLTHHLPHRPDILCLPDNDGDEATLLGTGVLEGECGSCGGVFWVPSNMGSLSCPYCRSTSVKQTWTTPRVAFIPQKRGNLCQE